jgi:hypothetical protein
MLGLHPIPSLQEVVMSQVMQPSVPSTSHAVSTRAACVVALLALVAAVAVALVIALSDGAQDTPAVNVGAQPTLRADGGPEETGIATAVGTRPSPAPSESAIAASIGTSTPQRLSGPDESRVAAAIARR